MKLITKELSEYLDTVEEMIVSLKDEVRELKATTPSYMGVWQKAQEYRRGQMVTDRGTLWHCNGATTERPGTGDGWTLMVKTTG
jgi:hypothetical protein